MQFLSTRLASSVSPNTARPFSKLMACRMQSNSRCIDGGMARWPHFSVVLHESNDS